MVGGTGSFRLSPKAPNKIQKLLDCCSPFIRLLAPQAMHLPNAASTSRAGFVPGVRAAAWFSPVANPGGIVLGRRSSRCGPVWGPSARET